MTELVSALRDVVAALEGLDISYALGGSVAAATWGVVRSTRDVDLVAVIPADAVTALAHRLADACYVSPLVPASSGEGASFNVIHLASGGKVDIFVPPAGDRFTQARLGRRIRSEVLGVTAWVSTAEDIVLAKLHWRQESRSEVQWRDCVEIAAVNSLDRGYLRAWGEELGIAGDVELLLRVTDEARR